MTRQYVTIQNAANVSTVCTECLNREPLGENDQTLYTRNTGECEECWEATTCYCPQCCPRGHCACPTCDEPCECTFTDLLDDALTAAGYATTVEHTGGGCMALVTDHPDGGHIVATDEGICRYPAGAWRDGGEATEAWWADTNTQIQTYIDTWQRLYTADLT